MENFTQLILDSRKKNEELLAHIVEDYCAKAFEALKDYLVTEPFFAESKHISVGIQSFDLINGTVEIETPPLNFSKCNFDSDLTLCLENSDVFCNLSLLEVETFVDSFNEALSKKGFTCYVACFGKQVNFYPTITLD